MYQSRASRDWVSQSEVGHAGPFGLVQQLLNACARFGAVDDHMGFDQCRFAADRVFVVAHMREVGFELHPLFYQSDVISILRAVYMSVRCVIRQNPIPAQN